MVDPNAYIGGGRKPVFDPGVESDRLREATGTIQREVEARLEETKKDLAAAFAEVTETDQQTRYLYQQSFT